MNVVWILMNFNAWTRAGCSRLINEQMAGALWVAVPCDHISNVGVAASRGVIVLLADLHSWSPIFTRFQEETKLRRKKMGLWGWNSSWSVIFLSFRLSEVAHSGSKTSPDNNQTFGQEKTKNICVGSISSWEAHTIEFMEFAALATQKQSVNN